MKGDALTTTTVPLKITRSIAHNQGGKKSGCEVKDGKGRVSSGEDLHRIIVKVAISTSGMGPYWKKNVLS